MFLSQIPHFHWFPLISASKPVVSEVCPPGHLDPPGVPALGCWDCRKHWENVGDVGQSMAQSDQTYHFSYFSYFSTFLNMLTIFGVGNWFWICCFEPRYSLKTTRLLKDEVTCFLQMLALAAHVWLIWNMLFIDICEYFDSTSMYILSLDRSAEQEIR